MLQVEFNQKSENPFYGMSNTLQIFQNGSKGMGVSKSNLDAAYAECKNDDQRALLFAVLFFIGDVTNRQHNIFGGKTDKGGNSQREMFRDTLVPFMWGKVKSMSKTKRRNFMTLIVEYTTMDNIFAARVKTKKNTSKVETVINMINVFGVEDVAAYATHVIQKGTTFQKMCLAKFITRPRFSKRAGKDKMLPETSRVMATKAELIEAISENCSFLVEDKGSYKNFTGFYNWRKEYNSNLESVLFSSGKIKDMDKEEFISFVDSCPSEARFRIRNRVMFGDKWETFKGWYTEWETFKDKAQARQRELETKIENGEATASEKEQLKTVKKQARVNTGAISFTKLFAQIVSGTVDRVKVQPFLDSIDLPYNNLVFVDDSGSMAGQWRSTGLGFTARQMGAFIATICMSKNPDPESRNLMGLFSNQCRMFNGISSYNTAPNQLLRGKTINIPSKPLIDSELHFLDNLQSVMQFLNNNSTGNGTNVSSIPDSLNAWVNGDPNRLEQIQSYPIWTLISDGNFNNLGGASTSLNDFMRRCENYFGFRPYLILIDVAGSTSQNITTFSGIDNVMMIPPNPASIEMFLTNFKDMDVYDVYTPLLSLSRSNRYDPVKNFVKGKVRAEKAAPVAELV